MGLWDEAKHPRGHGGKWSAGEIAALKNGEHVAVPGPGKYTISHHTTDGVGRNKSAGHITVSKGGRMVWQGHYRQSGKAPAGNAAYTKEERAAHALAVVNAHRAGGSRAVADMREAPPKAASAPKAAAPPALHEATREQENAFGRLAEKHGGLHVALGFQDRHARVTAPGGKHYLVHPDGNVKEAGVNHSVKWGAVAADFKDAAEKPSAPPPRTDLKFGAGKWAWPGFAQVDAMKAGETMQLNHGYTIHAEKNGTFTAKDAAGNRLLNTPNSAHAITAARNHLEGKSNAKLAEHAAMLKRGGAGSAQPKVSDTPTMRHMSALMREHGAEKAGHFIEPRNNPASKAHVERLVQLGHLEKQKDGTHKITSSGMAALNRYRASERKIAAQDARLDRT